MIMMEFMLLSRRKTFSLFFIIAGTKKNFSAFDSNYSSSACSPSTTRKFFIGGKRLHFNGKLWEFLLLYDCDGDDDEKKSRQIMRMKAVYKIV